MSKKNLFIFTQFLLLIPLFTFAQLTYPTKYPTAVIPHAADGHRLFFLYMPMQYDDNAGQDTFKLYYINKKTERTYLARSTNYGITWTDTQAVTVPSHESIIKNPDSSKRYMGYNVWNDTTNPAKSYFYSSVSTDGGFNFSNPLQVFELGEDKSFIWNQDTHEYWGYVRPRNTLKDCNCFIHDCYTLGNGVRKIALMKKVHTFPIQVTGVQEIQL